jgi:hypothetical protein
MKIRALTNAGLERFEDYLAKLHQGERISAPIESLESDYTSRTVSTNSEVEDRGFASRMEAVEYLANALKNMDASERDHDRGLWAWLSLFYFDRLCPADAEGRRSPGQSYRYIPSTHWQHYYRHLLLGPYRIHTVCGKTGRVMLCNAFGSHGDFAEQLASRQELLVNPALMELVDRLYFDPLLNRAKRGAATDRKPGTLRRLIDLVNQLDLTYDLYAITPDELEDLLPAEFDRWRS